MNCRRYSDYFPYNIVPVFLDTFNSDYDQILQVLKNVNCAVFTNYTIYSKVKVHYSNKRILYTPLGISSKWLLEALPNKDIDVVQIGRANKLLHEWMLKYCRSHEGINYIYRDTFENQHYISTLKGDIGILASRKDYMEILKRAKVSLVSTANVDSDNGECEFFTPRFFESASMYCHLIGRYGDSEESKILNMGSVCHRVNTYMEFENQLNVALCTEPDVYLYKKFLDNCCLANNIKKMELTDC